MTPAQLIEKCRERGVTLYRKEGDAIGCKGPKDVLTPRLLQTLKAHKSELLPLLSPSDPEWDDLVRLGAEVEAELTDEQEQRLASALDAARTRQMPVCDFTHPQYVEGFAGVALGLGRSTWNPGAILLNGVQRLDHAKKHWPDTWNKPDPKRPSPYRDMAACVQEVEAVVNWWHNYDGPKPDAKAVEEGELNANAE